MDGNQAVFVLLFFNGIEVRSRYSRRTKDNNAQSSSISNVYLAMRLCDIPSLDADWYQVKIVWDLSSGSLTTGKAAQKAYNSNWYGYVFCQ
jgi:hypothetical protein